MHSKRARHDIHLLGLIISSLHSSRQHPISTLFRPSTPLSIQFRSFGVSRPFTTHRYSYSSALPCERGLGYIPSRGLFLSESPAGGGRGGDAGRDPGEPFPLPPAPPEIDIPIRDARLPGVEAPRAGPREGVPDPLLPILAMLLFRPVRDPGRAGSA
jgi:hypothetical protein